MKTFPLRPPTAAHRCEADYTPRSPTPSFSTAKKEIIQSQPLPLPAVERGTQTTTPLQPNLNSLHGSAFFSPDMKKGTEYLFPVLVKGSAVLFRVSSKRWRSFSCEHFLE